MIYNDDRFSDDVEKIIRFIVFLIILGSLCYCLSGCKSKSHITRDYYQEQHDSTASNSRKTTKNDVYVQSNVLFTIEEGVLDVTFGDSGKIDIGSNGLNLSGVKSAKMKGSKGLFNDKRDNCTINEETAEKSNVSVSNGKKKKQVDKTKDISSKPSIDITAGVILALVLIIVFLYWKRKYILSVLRKVRV